MPYLGPRHDVLIIHEEEEACVTWAQDLGELLEDQSRLYIELESGGPGDFHVTRSPRVLRDDSQPADYVEVINNSAAVLVIYTSGIEQSIWFTNETVTAALGSRRADCWVVELEDATGFVFPAGADAPDRQVCWRQLVDGTKRVLPSRQSHGGFDPEFERLVEDLSSTVFSSLRRIKNGRANAASLSVFVTLTENAGAAYEVRQDVLGLLTDLDRGCAVLPEDARFEGQTVEQATRRLEEDIETVDLIVQVVDRYKGNNPFEEHEYGLVGRQWEIIKSAGKPVLSILAEELPDDSEIDARLIGEIEKFASDRGSSLLRVPEHANLERCLDREIAELRPLPYVLIWSEPSDLQDVEQLIIPEFEKCPHHNRTQVLKDLPAKHLSKLSYVYHGYVVAVGQGDAKALMPTDRVTRRIDQRAAVLSGERIPRQTDFDFRDWLDLNDGEKEAKVRNNISQFIEQVMEDARRW